MKKLIILAILVMASPLYAGSLTLKWSPANGVDGYRIVYGTNPTVLDSEIDVGNVTEYTVSGLDVGVTYYFRAKSYIGCVETNPCVESVLSYGAFGEAKLDPPAELMVE